jgi:hypothetical protein
MTLITIVTIAFMVLESLNILMMYLKPEFKYSNGIGVFNGWDMSKGNEEVHGLAKYLVRWVANTKLIFIGLLIVILAIGTHEVQLYSMLVMAVTTAAFFFALFPLIRKLDKKGHITPKNYSLILFLEVFLITGAFTTAFVLSILGIVPY